MGLHASCSLAAPTSLRSRIFSSTQLSPCPVSVRLLDSSSLRAKASVSAICRECCNSAISLRRDWNTEQGKKTYYSKQKLHISANMFHPGIEMQPRNWWQSPLLNKWIMKRGTQVIKGFLLLREWVQVHGLDNCNLFSLILCLRSVPQLIGYQANLILTA